MALEYLTLTNIAALATVDFMINSDQGEADARFIRRPSKVTFAIDANATGLELEVRAGLRTVVARSAVDAGGTPGVFPNLDQKAVSFFAASGDKLKFTVRETANVATTDSNLVIDVTPVA